MSAATPRPDALVVGAGLAGLTCALHLSRAGRRVQLLEAGDRPGGRVATDRVDGFLIDRGFQVLNSAYDEVRRTLDLVALAPGAFKAGAVVRREGGFHTLGDPLRHPASTWSSLTAPVGTLLDRWRMVRLDGWLRRRLASGRGDQPSGEALVEAGFSPTMIEAFLRPFLGGVFLERELETPVRQLAFVWSQFARGQALLPAGGMGAVPAQLASRLPPGCLRTGTPVEAVAPGRVTLVGGERLTADAVVVATEGDVAARLLGDALPATRWRRTVQLSYDAPTSPVDGPWLVLGGDGDGPINTLCVPSEVTPSYAPEGRALVNVSVVGEPAGGDDQALETAVRRQLVAWYGARVRDWRLLRIDRVRRALPVVGAERPAPRLPAGLHVAGDHLELPSIQHAMLSGRRAAESVLTGRDEVAAA